MQSTQVTINHCKAAQRLTGHPQKLMS